jgi:hypothetical protein
MYGFALAVTLSLIDQTQNTPKVKYDKFDSITSISMSVGSFPVREGRAYITMNVQHGGKEPKKFDGSVKVTLAFSHFGERWLFHSSHDAKMMCGDTHIPLEDQSYSSEITNEDSSELIFTRLKLETIRQFLKRSEDWEVKLGTEDPFSLTAKTRANMRSFVRFLEEGKG